MRFMNIRPIILLLALVSAVVIGCSAAPTPVPAPSGPSITEEEAIATVKQHLQSKSFHDLGNVVPCWAVIESNKRRANPNPLTWSANYDAGAYRWDVTGAAKGWTAAEWAERPVLPSFRPTKKARALPTPSEYMRQHGLTFLSTPLAERFPTKTKAPPRAVVYSWSLYERTGSVVATGDETLNKLC
jgi:hypothetical protein